MRPEQLVACAALSCAALRRLLQRREAEPEVQAPLEDEAEEEEEEESEWETDTDEDDAPGRKIIKPMFVPKARPRAAAAALEP